MPWLDFANHFLSNQRLHVWSWINRTFSWEWCFLVGNSVLSILGLFLFCFCLVWGEKVTDAQDFGWQSKGEDHFRSWFPFFFCLLGDNSVFFRCCLVQRPFYTFLLFSSDFWSGIFFLLLSSSFWLGIFSFPPIFFCFLPRARFMVSWDFGSRFVERMDMIYVRVLVWLVV